MNTHRLSFDGIYDLCQRHYEDIILHKPLKHVLNNRRVRFVNPKGRFDYCYFGDFYFGSNNVMMLITNDSSYVCYHRPDQLSNTLWSTIPVIFAGVETGVRDDAGNMIFTYDYCDFGMYRLMVQYISFEEPCLLADNHMVPLSWARTHGGFRKSGTSLYDLRKEMFEVFDQWEIWHVNQFDDTDERQKANYALKEPIISDGLPEPNKRWSRDYLNIDDVMCADTVLAYFKSSFKEDYVDESGEWHEDYVLFIDNYPYEFNGEHYEMVVENENYQQLVNDLLLKAHKTPNKCFVLCDFFKNIVIYEEKRNEYAQYFKSIIEYHIPNITLPKWIIEEWIRDIEIEF